MDLSNLKKGLLEKTKDIKNDINNYKQHRSMGLGQLGDCDIVFVRKFRWTLKGRNLKEHYIKNVAFDFVHKTINLEAMEVISSGDKDMELHAWLESNLKEEVLHFTTYDGCGKSLYEYEIVGLKLVADNADFDYKCSDESTRKVMLSYTNLKRKFFPKPGANQAPYKKKQFIWTAGLAGDKAEFEVKVGNRPNLTLEETNINFLNEKTWIPGKMKWEHVKLTLLKPHGVEVKMLGELVAGKNPTVVLNLYQDLGTNPFESWSLKHCELLDIKTLPSEKEGDPDNKYELSIRYQQVNYKNWSSHEHGNQSECQSRSKGECQPASEVCKSSKL